MERIDLGSHRKGDTWPGLRVTGVLFDGVAPAAIVASARMQFRLKQDRTLGYEMNDNPGVGQGNITVNDAAAWDITVDAQVLDMPVGVYLGDLEVTDANGMVLTIAHARIKILQDYAYND